MFLRVTTLFGRPGASGAAAAPATACGDLSALPANRRWSAQRSRIRARLAAEEGFTIIEVLVTAAILAAVLTALLTPFEFAQSQTPKEVEYAKSITEASTGLQEMMREIRQAYRVDSTTPNSITFNATINSSNLEILYECDLPYPENTGNTHWREYHRCRRVSATTGHALPAIATGGVVIDRLLDGTSVAPVFTFKDSSGHVNATNPTYVEAKILVPARGPLNSGLNHAIELKNGTEIPNLAPDS
jgi:prepilin-type N-terminal cleavage/methylation domain-containing protein